MSQEQILKIVEKEKIVTIKTVIRMANLNWRTTVHSLTKLVQNGEIGRIHHPGWISLYCSKSIMEELNGNKNNLNCEWQEKKPRTKNHNK